MKLQHPVKESCTTRRFSSFCKAVNSLDRWRIKVTAGQRVPNMFATAQGSKARRNCHKPLASPNSIHGLKTNCIPGFPSGNESIHNIYIYRLQFLTAEPRTVHEPYFCWDQPTSRCPDLSPRKKTSATFGEDPSRLGSRRTK